MYPGVGTFVLIRPAQTFYERIMLDLYDYAAANDLIVMIHPELSDMEDLHGTLINNPNTIFLLHGLVNSAERAPIAEELETLFWDHTRTSTTRLMQP